MSIKICRVCNESKSLIEYSTRPNNKHRTECKVCQAKFHAEYREKNKEQLKDKFKAKYDANAEALKAKAKQFYQENKDSIKDRCAAYYKNNKEKVSKSSLMRQRDRLKTDPIFKLKRRLRARMYDAVKSRRVPKIGKLNEYLGTADWGEVRSFLEASFTADMTWENHGTAWDIDHVIPLRLAKTSEELRSLSAYYNLQALHPKENRNRKYGNFNVNEDLTDKIVTTTEVVHSFIDLKWIPPNTQFVGKFTNRGVLTLAYGLDGELLAFPSFLESELKL